MTFCLYLRLNQFWASLCLYKYKGCVTVWKIICTRFLLLSSALSTSCHRSEIVPTQVIVIGSVSPAHAFGRDHVIKRCPPSTNRFSRQAFDIEVGAYKRLGEHRRISVLRDITNEGLVSGRGECLRKKIQSLELGKIPLCTRLPWARDAAEGLCYIHSKGIIHADVGCHNLILDRTGHIRFIDFAGSGIDEEAPLVCYEWYAYRSGSAIGVKTDIFAFGSMLFEIESGFVPYHELCGTMEMFDLMRVVERRFAMREYPYLGDFLLGPIIVRCWDRDYSCMHEVEAHLRGLSVIEDNPSPAAEIVF